MKVAAWTSQEDPSDPMKFFFELPPEWHWMRPRSADVTVDVADVVTVDVPVEVTVVFVCAVFVAVVVAVVVCVAVAELDGVEVTVVDPELEPVVVILLVSEVVAVDVTDDVPVEVTDVVTVLVADVVADDVCVVVTVVFLQFERAPPLCVLIASFSTSITLLHVAAVLTLSTRVRELHEMELAMLESSNQCSTRSERRVAVVLHSSTEWALRSTCTKPTPSCNTHSVSPCVFPPPGQSSRRLLISDVCLPQSFVSVITKY